MENKKHQKPIPEELKDEQLETVTGGDDLEFLTALYSVMDTNERTEEIKEMIEAGRQTLSKIRGELHRDRMTSVLDQTQPSLPPAELPGIIETSGRTLPLPEKG